MCDPLCKYQSCWVTATCSDPAKHSLHMRTGNCMACSSTLPGLAGFCASGSADPHLERDLDCIGALGSNSVQGCMVYKPFPTPCAQMQVFFPLLSPFSAIEFISKQIGVFSFLLLSLL